MAKFYYNDVLLPEIPQDALENYQYLAITTVQQSDTIRYCLSASNSPFYVSSFEYSGSIIYTIVPSDFNGGAIGIYSSVDLESFNNNGTEDPNEFGMFISDCPPLGITGSLIWTNTDIPNGSADSTEIYLAASDPVPFEDLDFLIKESTLNAIGDQVRRISGIADKLSTSKMLEIFGNVLSVEGVKF